MLINTKQTLHCVSVHAVLLCLFLDLQLYILIVSTELKESAHPMRMVSSSLLKFHAHSEVANPPYAHEM